MKQVTFLMFLLFIAGLYAADFASTEGTVVFKLKPQYRDYISKSANSLGLQSLDARLTQLKATKLAPYFNVSPSKSSGHEITLIYTLETTMPKQAAVNLLAADEHVQYAEIVYPDEVFAVPNDPNYATSTYFAPINAEAAWDIHKGEDGLAPVVIAIVDTGTKWDHVDLGANIWNNLGEDFNGNGYTHYYNGAAWVMDAGDINGVDDDANGKIDDLIGWDFMLNAAGDQANDPFDAGSHGTIVSGLACTVTNNAVGTLSLAWNLTLMPISCAYGAGTIYRGYEGVIYAAENGADIINCSWGGSSFSQANQDAINYAYSLGSIIVAAAGNSNNTVPVYPSAYENVLSVAALLNTGVKSAISSYGGFVDLAVPTSNMNSTHMTGGYFTTTSGATSYATPVATALAGLIKSYIPTITQEELIARIKGSCNDVDALNPGKENMFGEGMIDAFRALSEADPQPDEEVRLYLIENQGATDANGNLAVEPGETFSVNLLLRSYSPVASNGTFILSTTSTVVNITSNTHLQSIPSDGYFTLDDAFSIYVLPTATSRYVTFTLTTTADLPVVAGNTITFTILIHAGGLFIWEGVAGGRDMSGAYIRTTLQAMGYTCTYGTTFPPSFFSFDAVFLSFGAVGSNITRFDKTYMFTALRNYLESGGRVYIEGVDVVGFDMANYFPDIDGTLDGHEVLWPLLGVQSASDGATNAIDALTGVNNTPTAGISFAASTQTKVDYIDTFTPAAGNTKDAFNESGYGCVGVVSEGAFDQRSFVFSYALRELTDGVFPNTRANLLDRIMEFFEAEEVTLPLELVSFSTTFTSVANVLWSTASETDLIGFNLYRAISEDYATAIKANPQLIAASGGANGASYSFQDTEIPLSENQYYWLEALSYNGQNQVFGPVSLIIPIDSDPETPQPPNSGSIIFQAYPNPFGRAVSLELGLQSKASINIRIYNLKGQLVKNMDTADYEAGTHFLNWDGQDSYGKSAASGLYFMELNSGYSTIKRKLVKL